MELPTYFTKFLQDIRPTESQKDDCKTGHQTLRKRLESYEDLKKILVSTFLQGSYRRATAVRPKGEVKLDVDIITVTRLKREDYPNPDDAMDIFVPFLDEYYEDKYKRQGRSFGIELSYVNLDLVITSAPSEAEEEIYKSQAIRTFLTPEDIDDWRLIKSWVPPEKRSSQTAIFQTTHQEQEWKTEPLWIPNRDAGDWEQTHPLEQIKWTWGKNARCNTHYVNIVKAIKWWQRVHHPDDRPKGYPLEHLVGVCCPDDIKSVAKGVTLTLETIVENYSDEASKKETPYLCDHGVDHDVFGRVDGEEFAEFYEHAKEAAEIAREALDAETKEKSIEKWKKLFGSKFPGSDDSDDNGNRGNSSKGPFVAPPRQQTGDLTPRKYG